jgi:hypothetical protein
MLIKENCNCADDLRSGAVPSEHWMDPEVRRVREEVAVSMTGERLDGCLERVHNQLLPE